MRLLKKVPLRKQKKIYTYSKKNEYSRKIAQ